MPKHMTKAMSQVTSTRQCYKMDDNKFQNFDYV